MELQSATGCLPCPPRPRALLADVRSDLPLAAARAGSLLAGLNDAQQRAAGSASRAAWRRRRRRRRCWSSPAPARARRRRWPTGSPAWCARRRPAAHPAADVLAARRAGDGAPRRPRPARGARPRARAAGAAAAVGRHLPRHRRAPAAPVRAADRAGRELHHPRPRRRGRPDGSGAPRARPRETARAAFRARRPAWRSTRACVNTQEPLADVLRRVFPWCLEWEDELQRLFARLRRREAGAARARLRRPAALLGPPDGRAGAGARESARASTTCWSTSTRTPTGCRPRSCWR